MAIFCRSINNIGKMRIHTADSEIALAKLQDPVNFKHLGKMNLYAEPACKEELYLNSIPSLSSIK